MTMACGHITPTATLPQSNIKLPSDEIFRNTSRWRCEAFSVDGLGQFFTLLSPALPSPPFDPKNLVLTLGNPISGEKVLSAIDCKTLLEREGLDALLGLDGSYLQVIHEKSTEKVHLFTDPIGSVPIYWTCTPAGLYFGPTENTVLELAGKRPELNSQSARQFLLNRYLIGRKTLFTGINRLPPGTKLVFDLHKNTANLETYWRFKFDYSRPNRRESVEELHEALRVSCELFFRQIRPGSSYNIFLTGGWDSRGILGFASKANTPPKLALTWGATDLDPNADPAIAKELASLLRIPFQFLKLEPAAWPENFSKWLTTDTLNSDNGINYCLNRQQLDAFLSPVSDVTVIGDECFGAGPLAISADEAIRNSFATSLLDSTEILGRVLKPDALAQTITEFQQELDAQVMETGATNPKDIQDILFLYNYVSRWLLAPGVFKLPVRGVSRPFLNLRTLNWLCKQPPEYRVDKSIFIEMMKHYFPQLCKLRASANDGGLQWPKLCREIPTLRRALQELLSPERLRRLPIADSIDLNQAETFLNHFFSSRTPEVQTSGRGTRIIYDLRRVLTRNPLLKHAIRFAQPLAAKVLRRQKQMAAFKESQLVLRLALLSAASERGAPANAQ
jgi:hypothetical protein